ncbi:MAG: arginase family protein [Frisingicoccus sp.]
MTLGAIRAASEKYPELHIIHFDAHTDLREDYLGVKLSHACVLRRCWELWVTDAFISSVSVREKDMNSVGQEGTRTCIL